MTFPESPFDGLPSQGLAETEPEIQDEAAVIEARDDDEPSAAEELVSEEPLDPEQIAECLERISDPHLSHLVLTNAGLNGHELTSEQAMRLMDQIMQDEDIVGAFYIDLLAAGMLGLSTDEGGLDESQDWWPGKLVESLMKTENADLAASILETADAGDSDLLDAELRAHLESIAQR